MSESLNTLTTLELKEGDTMKALPVSGAWGAGAYAVVLAYRPLDKATARNFPSRSTMSKVSPETMRSISA